MAVGRFAPSPSGSLHLGSLRTALLAWLFARSAGSAFLVRVEDLDVVASRDDIVSEQLRDLARLGIDWDGEPVRQSARRGLYKAALDELIARDLTYPCYCTRREIREAASAPHEAVQPEGAYPGTCRALSAAERAERERAGRPPALRLRAGAPVVRVVDELAGPVEAVVDDIVLRRNDGTPAYNLAVVVDDADQGIEQVVRGDDLLLTTPRQVFLAGLLDRPVPAYAHVPMVLGPSGKRLAKRDGSITLDELAAVGWAPDRVRSWLASSVGLAEPGEPVSTKQLLARFTPDARAALPRTPWQPHLAHLP